MTSLERGTVAGESRAVHQRPDLRVVGVATDVKVASLSEAPALLMYLPFTQVDLPYLTFVARTSLDSGQMALAMATAGRALDPDLIVAETTTMARNLAWRLLPTQLGTFVVSMFAVLALALSAIGLYGVVSYSVASRTREVGIRMALGASTQAIIRLLAGDGVRLVLVGAGIGQTLALLVSRLVSELIGTRTTDPPRVRWGAAHSRGDRLAGLVSASAPRQPRRTGRGPARRLTNYWGKSCPLSVSPLNAVVVTEDCIGSPRS